VFITPFRLPELVKGHPRYGLPKQGGCCQCWADIIFYDILLDKDIRSKLFIHSDIRKKKKIQFKYLGWISYIQGFLFNSDQCFFCAEFSQPGDPKRKKKELANPTKDFLKKKQFKSPYLKKKNFRNPHILIVCSCN